MFYHKFPIIILNTFLLIYSGFSNSSKLISIDSFSQHIKYQSVKLSPNGQYLAVETTNDSLEELIVIIRISDMEVISSLRFSNTDFPVNPVWLNNDRVLVSVAEKIGPEQKKYYTGELFAMNIDGSQKEWLIKKRSGIRVAGKGSGIGNELSGNATLINTLPLDKDHILISVEPFGMKKKFRLNRLYKINMFTGKVKIITKSPIESGRFITDINGELKMVWGVNQDNDNLEVFEFKMSRWHLYQSLGVIGMIPLAFDDKNEIIYFNKPFKDKPNALISMDVNSKEETLIFQHTTVDFQQVDFDQNNSAYAVHFEPNYSDLKLLKPYHQLAKWYPALYKAFPDSRIKISSYDNDVTKFIFEISSDRIVKKYYLFNTETKKYRLLLDGAPKLAFEDLADSFPISYKARDGKTINGYITLPQGVEQNLPFVVLPHGGPISRDYWEYNWLAQFLANRGYAVLQINYRGSSGYGSNFETSGYQHWGDLIQFDILDGITWAKNIKVADPEKICIVGSSFGGYSALMSASISPEVFKCTVGISGVYDLNLLWDEGDISDYNYGKNYLSKVIGTNNNKLFEFSPVNRAREIKIPVLLIHSEDDIRAPLAHYTKMYSALKNSGSKVEGIVLQEESHSLSKIPNRQKLLKELENFLHKHIGN